MLAWTHASPGTSAARDGWLLILDNVVDPAAVVPVLTVTASTLSQPGDDPVTRTWLVTIAAIAEENRLAVTLLDMLAYLAPEAVPLKVLVCAVGDLLAVDGALALIASYSLISRGPNTVAVHRLFQTAARATYHGGHALTA